jgi:hypothetical protein
LIASQGNWVSLEGTGFSPYVKLHKFKGL